MRGFKPPRTIGMSSRTVGWIGTAHYSSGAVAPAFIIGYAVDGLVTAGAPDQRTQDGLLLSIHERT